MRYFALDIETTGLCIETDYILEVSVVYDNGGPLAELPSLTLVLKRDDIRGSIPALLMHAHNGLLEECLKSQVPSGSLIYRLNDWLLRYEKSKPVFAGKNVSSFDLPFLDRHGDRHGQGLIPRCHRVLDIGSMYSLSSDIRPPALSECCARAGVVFDNVHRSLSDCMAVVGCVRSFFNKE